MGPDSRRALPWMTITAFFAFACPAIATDRYAIPVDTTPGGACPQSNPCELQAAINVSSPGDTIKLAAGTYESVTGGFRVDRRLTLDGGGAEKPVIESRVSGKPALDLVAGVSDSTALLNLEFRGPADAFAVDGFDNTDQLRSFDVKSVALLGVRIDTLGSCIRTGIGSAQNLEFKTSSRAPNTDCADFNGDGSNSSPVMVKNLTVEAPLDGQVRGAAFTGAITSDNVRIVTGGVGGQILNGVHRRWNVTGGVFGVTLQRFGVGVQPKTQFTDAIVRSTGDAIFVLSGQPTLRNVTAVGGQRGVVADGADSIFAGSDPILVNVIARGASPAQDLAVEPNGCDPTNDPFPPTCTPAGGRMSAEYTNARNPPNAAIATGAGMQTAEPFCAFGDDLHLPAISPARNAGLNSAVVADPDITGSAPVDKDADGDPRIQDGVVDIGGDEAPASGTCQPPVDPSQPGGTQPSGGTQQPPSPPVIVDATAPAFTATLSAARFTVPKGTKIKVKGLTEAATMRFRILQKAAGRRSGKKCVAPTRRNAGKRKCTRTLDRGSFTRRLAAGSSTTAFSGRLKGKKAYAPGRYSLELRATDAAGNRSATRTLAFRIVKR